MQTKEDLLASHHTNMGSGLWHMGHTLFHCADALPMVTIYTSWQHNRMFVDFDLMNNNIFTMQAPFGLGVC